MSTKQKILAEIDGRIQANKTKNGFPAGILCAARIEAYAELIAFINSLPDEASAVGTVDTTARPKNIIVKTEDWEALFDGFENGEKAMIDEAIDKYVQATNSIIERAFLKHFGFQISEVEDRENLEVLITNGCVVQAYRYRGETFLYVEEVEIIMDPYLTKPEWTTIIARRRYKEV